MMFVLSDITFLPVIAVTAQALRDSEEEEDDLE